MAKYGWLSLIVVLLAYTAFAYSVYSNIYSAWRIAPPSSVILIVSLLALILGIIGVFRSAAMFSKLRSWMAIILSVILVVVLSVTMAFTTLFSGAKEHLTTVHSPDDHYTIRFDDHTIVINDHEIDLSNL